jgi:FAD/FMN-containing dehydrogenase
MLDRRLVKSLARTVGRQHVLTQPADLLVYSYDSSTAVGTPDAVVLPASTEQVAGILRLCHQHRLPFIARGAGTNLSGGSAPVHGGLVVGLTRMNRVLEVDAANQVAVVQPGVVNLQFQALLAPDGLQFCPDPASQKVSTIGGNVAENAGGPHCLKYGVTVNHVLGLTVVLPSGEVRQLGSRALETCSEVARPQPGKPRPAHFPGGNAPLSVCPCELPGYDLVGLFIGSEGTFGVATEMILRLRPLPESTQVVVAIFDTLEASGEAVSRIIAEGILAAALEIMDRSTMEAVEASFPSGLPTDAEALLLIELDGLKEALDRRASRCAEICREFHARQVEIGRTAEERERLWAARRSAFGATARLSPSMLVNDATVPRTRIPEVLRQMQDIERRHGLRIAKVFHAGDGNLHSNILFRRDDPAELERAKAASVEIFHLCASVGGTITGEHGVGAEKPEHMKLIYSPADLDAQWQLKRIFDPLAIANPGKVLPGSLHGQNAVVLPSFRQATLGPHGQTSHMPGGQDAAGSSVGASALGRLEAVVSPPHLFTATAQVSEYAVEGRTPLAVASPGSAEEVAGLLRTASEAQLSVLLRGAGRHHYLGAPPEPIGLVVSLTRLNAIVEYDPQDLTVTAQAGISMGELQRVLGEHGQMLPLDPPGPEAATLGGIASANLAGPMRTRHGSPRDLVIGLRAALTNGEVIKAGGRTVKNVAGYAINRLFVGSLGSVGAITEITARLVPLPEARATLAAPLAPAAAAEVTSWLVGSQLEVAACQVLNYPAAQRLRGVQPPRGGRPPEAGQTNSGSPAGRVAGLPVGAPARGRPLEAGQTNGGLPVGAPGQQLLLVGLAGDREAVARQEREIRSRVREIESLDPEAADAAWDGVRALAYPGLAAVLVRVVVPLSRVHEMIALVSLRQGWSASAQAGDGLVHVSPPDGEPEPQTSDGLMAIRAAAEQMGGYAVLESGPVELKRRHSVWGQMANLELMLNLKGAYDPVGILGCGRLLGGM